MFFAVGSDNVAEVQLEQEYLQEVLDHVHILISVNINYMIELNSY